MASAIKKRTDVDVTVKVRFDLDGPFGTPTVDELETPTNYTLSNDGNGKFVWNKQIN